LIQVVDQAVPPDSRSSPKRRLIVIVATALGFFFGVFVALIQIGFRRLKDNQEAIQKLYLLRKALSVKG